MNTLAASIIVYLIITLVPFPIYMLFTKYAGLAEPDNPRDFFASVLTQKIGMTIGLVLIFYAARETFTEDWFVFALIWFVMYAVIEVGQALGPQYSWKEAFAGIAAEAIYFPLAAYVLQIMIK